MQLPNDRMAEGDWPLQTQDITSGQVHALAACWRHRVTFAGDTASVNLLFDFRDDALFEIQVLDEQGIVHGPKGRDHVRERQDDEDRRRR